MRIELAHKRRRVLGQAAPIVLPDFSGLNISRIFSLFKTQQATTNLCFEIVTTQNINTAIYVFYDPSGQISTSSPTSSTTTDNEGTTLQDVIDTHAPGIHFLVTKWYCQITGELVNSNGTNPNAPILAENLTINTKNGKPAIKFTGATGQYFNKRFITSPFSELNSTNNFSLTSVSANDTAGAVGCVIGNNRSATILNDSRIGVFNDGRSAKLIGLIKDKSGVQTNIETNTTNATTNQKRLTMTYDGANIKGYYNGSVQTDVEPFTSDWENSDFIIGSQRTGSTQLVGNIQFVAVHNAGLTGAQVTTLDGKLNDFFSF